jgi:hypothetical protein
MCRCNASMCHCSSLMVDGIAQSKIGDVMLQPQRPERERERERERESRFVDQFLVIVSSIYE